MKRILNPVVAAALAGLSGLFPVPALAADPAPRLVLQITVDQQRYDTFVPLIFAGYGLKPRRVETVDLAPTLPAIVGLKPPSGTAGSPRAEVLEAGNP